MYWSKETQTGTCTPPPNMDQFEMKFDSLEEQEKDPYSIYEYVRQAITLRQTHPAIRSGSCTYVEKISGGKLCVLIKKTDNELIHYPLDANQWLTDAQYFAFCDNADILFMASGSKIASIAVIGGSPVFREINWSPDSKNEVITGIKFYTQGWYGTHGFDYNSYSFPLATNRMQVVIITHNEKTGEGKIYLRPFNVSTGLFTYKDNGVYGGFGRITAITTTFK